MSRITIPEFAFTDQLSAPVRTMLAGFTNRAGEYNAAVDAAENDRALLADKAQHAFASGEMMHTDAARRESVDLLNREIRLRRELTDLLADINGERINKIAGAAHAKHQAAMVKVRKGLESLGYVFQHENEPQGPLGGIVLAHPSVRGAQEWCDTVADRGTIDAMNQNDAMLEAAEARLDAARQRAVAAMTV